MARCTVLPGLLFFLHANGPLRGPSSHLYTGQGDFLCVVIGAFEFCTPAFDDESLLSPLRSDLLPKTPKTGLFSLP